MDSEFRVAELIPQQETTDGRLLNRVKSILSLFAGSQQAWSFAEISEATELSKSTTHRFLKGLCDEELLQRSTDNGAYSLGPLMIQLAARVFGPEALRSRGGPILRRLAAATNETTLMCQLASSGDSVICVEQVESPHGIRLVADVGARLPLHAGGASRAILAFMPQADIEAVLSKLPENRAVRLAQQLRRTRETGYGMSFGETNEGVGGIAAPIFDPLQRVIGSIATIGPMTRMTEPRLLELAPRLVAAAAEMNGAVAARAINPFPELGE